MQRHADGILVFLWLFFLIAACSSGSHSTNLDSWIGEYRYEEEPVKSNDGYSMVMEWALSIIKEKDTCFGVLEINGHQTYTRLSTNIAGDSNTIAITYKKRVEGIDEALQKKDTLFLLSKAANKLKTKWMAFTPILMERTNKECECFMRTKDAAPK
jgi:hypothetical protein